MNYQAEIYRDLAKLLREGCDIRWVDMDRGQMQRQSQEHPMPKPAVLIGIGDVQWHTATGKQYGDMEVEVTVYLERGEETYAGAEGGAEALEKLSWQDRIYEKLEGQSGKNWQGLTRRQSRRAEWGAREVKLGSVWRCTVVQARPSRDVEVRSVELKVEN